MTIALVLIAVLTLGSAAAALARRNLIHAALLLAVSWTGMAAFYLWAGAEFAAFAQVLVYVGAISMVVLFAVLLTRQNPAGPPPPVVPARTLAALLVGAAVAAALAAAVLSVEFRSAAGPAPALTVRAIGEALMHEHAAALLIAGVLLTVSLLGAVVIAAADPKRRPEDAP